MAKNWARATFYLIILVVLIGGLVAEGIWIGNLKNRTKNINTNLCKSRGWDYYNGDTYDCIDREGMLHVLEDRYKYFPLAPFILLTLNLTAAFLVLLYGINQSLGVK